MEIVTDSTERRNLMSNWNGEERRKCPRYHINKDVQLKLQDDLLGTDNLEDVIRKYPQYTRR